MPLPGDSPGVLYYWLPVKCADCDWWGFVVGFHPRPDHLMRPMCAGCGHHHLQDREPDPDDDGWYQRGPTVESIVRKNLQEHDRKRSKRWLEPTVGRGIRIFKGKRGYAG